LPNENYRYSTGAEVAVRGNGDCTVTITGLSVLPPIYNHYDKASNTWFGWQTIATVADLSKAMKNYQYINTTVNNDDELNAALQSLHDKSVNSSHYQTILNIGYGSLFSGGYKWVEGCRQTENYGWQKVTSWSNGSPREYWRSLYAGTWTEWAEVANHNDYLSLDGGGTVKGAKSTLLILENTSSDGCYQEFRGSNGKNGSLGFIGANNAVILTTANNAYALHHDGNSAKVVISQTAPSDNKALWVY